ncbi:hypothetical protein MF271_18525 (plasmid) [Deinococcus sp. KNUC1210]|uniref:hypothetical protein n=1 Tax=Deinococcus sp. KNUC1210 TaxID=2917691 RepID=UPI001EF0F30F|nr:hypothetical protein [Deinococcus sp. KNUC1210]ULH17127.1 hypothetical protein MF271_18525 [Deinococcus sp. KNUC1210]
MWRGLNLPGLNLLSLRLKLTIGYALIFSVSVMLGALSVFLAARGTLTHSLDANLRDTAQVAQSGLTWTGGQPHFPPLSSPAPRSRQNC